MESVLQSAIAVLRSSIRTRDEDAVAKTLGDLELSALEFDVLPDFFVDELVRFLGDADFLSLNNSWKVLYFINNNWGQLSDKDRASLRNVMANSFDRYADWMGAFQTAEILGEHYADEETLQILASLGKTAKLPAKAAVPHALETLAKTTPQAWLRRSAVQQLRLLEKGLPAEVRREASIALKTLGSLFPEEVLNDDRT